MEGEFTKEAVAQATEAQDKAPEAKPAEAPPQPSEKTYTQKELDAAVLEERRIVSKHTARIKELEGKAHLSEAQTKELARLSEKLEDMEALMLDRGDAPVTEKSHYQQLQERRAKERTQQAQPAMTPTQAAEVVSLESLREDADVKWGSPEASEVSRIYVEEGFSSARRYLKGLIEGKGKPKEAPKMETPEEMEKRITAKLRKEFGLDSVDTETPAGGSTRTFTRRQITEMSDKEYQENRAAIEVARQAGRIK